MKIGRRWSGFALAALLFCGAVSTARAQVAVTIDGDTAFATISLPDGNGGTYDADVTIVFDTPGNLSVESLNLTAEVVDPSNMGSRLPGGVTVDPRFPVMITVEPPDYDWIFTTGSDGGNDNGEGYLSFHNTYAFEIHTHDLTYTPGTTYRLFKAPVDGSFDDITNEVLSGSVRARGRHGAFSQFMIVSDTRLPLVVALAKLVALDLRIVGAILSDVLRLDLLQLISKIQVLILIDVQAAIAALDELIGDVEANSGTEISNLWTARHDTVNDAGEILADAYTLRYSMVLLQGPTAASH